MSHTLQLPPLLLSRSPLLPSLAITDDSSAVLSMKRNMPLVPSLCFDNKRKAITPLRLSSSSTVTSLDTPVSSLPFLPYVDRTRKKLPSLPVSAKQIISLLNLLERVDDDVVGEVQRVKESIKEARLLVREFEKERRAKETERMERHERDKKETKQVGGDFWLGV